MSDCDHKVMLGDSIAGPTQFVPCPWCQRDELLQALIQYVEDAESQISHGKPESPFYKRLQAGRAAIARATGAANSTAVKE